jgi:hypothetical protein
MCDSALVAMPVVGLYSPTQPKLATRALSSRGVTGSQRRNDRPGALVLAMIHACAPPRTRASADAPSVISAVSAKALKAPAAVRMLE